MHSNRTDALYALRLGNYLLHSATDVGLSVMLKLRRFVALPERHDAASFETNALPVDRITGRIKPLEQLSKFATGVRNAGVRRCALRC